LREVFSAKFHLTEAHFHKIASPGKFPLHRYIRVFLPFTASGQHPFVPEELMDRLPKTTGLAS
jgi:hypothetical protein